MVKRIGETTYKETAFGIIPRSKLIPMEIEGMKKAWDFVLEQNKKGNIALTQDSIKEIHHIAFSWIFPKSGGKFRQVEVRVSKHIPPKPHLIPELMENILRDVRERLKHLPKLDEPFFIDSLTELLAWTHHQFLFIHPFFDYNGRIGRLLINIILLNLNLPPIELKIETPTGRKKYIRALQQADQGDLSELQKLIRAAIEEAASEV